MNIRFVILCFSLLLAAPLVARESTDVIVMKNGDPITFFIKEAYARDCSSVGQTCIIRTFSDD